MDMLPSSSLTGLGEVPSTTDLFMRGRLAKLELSDGNNVYAKLVVGVISLLDLSVKPFLYFIIVVMSNNFCSGRR